MIVAIIQARMGSRRLPGKVLADIAGKPLLAHVVARTQRAKTVDLVVVATSRLSGDDPIAEFCAREGIPCFRGEENDVLDRFYHCACHYQASVVVRITADCPLIDPAVIDRVVQRYRVGDCDFAANCLRYTYPHGLDVEVFGFAVLERAWREATSPTHREHVTDFIRTHPRMRCINVESDIDLRGEEHRWTVDHPCDLEFVRAVYKHLGADGSAFTMCDVLELVNKKPELRQINAGAVRHDGYYHTILEETRQALEASAGAAVAPARDPFVIRYLELSELASGVGKGGRIRTPRGEYVDLWLRGGGIVLGHDYPHPIPRPGDKASELQSSLEQRIAAMSPNGSVAALTDDPNALWSALSRRLQRIFRKVILVRSGLTAARHPLQLNQNVSLVAIGDDEHWRPRLAGDLSTDDAVIVDPVGLEKEKLQAIAQVAESAGILILDESHTWLRFSRTGAAEWAGIDVGAAVLGRTIGNGKPIAGIVGEPRIVGDLHLPRPKNESLATAHWVLDTAEGEPLAPQIWEQGRKIQDGFNVIAQELGIADRVALVGAAPAAIVHCDSESTRQYLSAKLQEAGVVAGDRVFCCYQHGEAEVELALRGFASALLRLDRWMSENHRLRDTA